ncbi:MAG: AgmX/PglI C-terminal domain-containing protein [Myxococcaceae bacterium]|nr:MAG: AgmX/PglI C-terminal domain-containing protein [Myxococcaceae bacterium]
MRRRPVRPSPEERVGPHEEARPLVGAARPRSPPPPPSPPPPAESRQSSVHTGSLPRESVRDVIRSLGPRVKGCFEKAAPRYPGPQKVTVAFTLQGQGLSGYIEDEEIVDSTIPDPWFQACFLEVLHSATFSAPKDGTVRITYPFVYQHNQDGGT